MATYQSSFQKKKILGSSLQRTKKNTLKMQMHTDMKIFKVLLSALRILKWILTGFLHLLERDLIQQNFFFFSHITNLMFSRCAFHQIHNKDLRRHLILWSTGDCNIKINFQIAGSLVYLLPDIGTLLHSTGFWETRNVSNLTEQVQAEMQAKKHL